MIAIVILILFILLVLTTPWRRLSAPARLWALVACSNALVFFGMPTTPATSPWRPIVGRVLATSAAVSLTCAADHRRTPGCVLYLFLGHRTPILREERVASHRA